MILFWFLIIATFMFLISLIKKSKKLIRRIKQYTTCLYFILYIEKYMSNKSVNE